MNPANCIASGAAVTLKGFNYNKPPLAPKPKLVSHLTFKVPFSHMSRPCSSTRGPKPPIAPKPIVLHDPEDQDTSPLSHIDQHGYTNGRWLPLDQNLDQENTPEDSLIGGEELKEENTTEDSLSGGEELNEENTPEDSLIGGEELNEENTQKDCLGGGEELNEENTQKDSLIGGEELNEENTPVKPQHDSCNLRSVINTPSDGNEENMEQEEKDWGLVDNVLPEDTLGCYDTGFPLESADVVEMNDMDVTGDINPKGCYAGEALADTDDLSVCDLYVTSIEEEEPGYTCECGPGEEEIVVARRKSEEDRRNEEEETSESKVGGVTESFSEEPIDLVADIEVTRFQEEVDVGVDKYKPYSIIDEEPITSDYTMEESECQLGAEQLFHQEKEAVDPNLEPNYISTEDIVDSEQGFTEVKAHVLAERENTPEESTLVTSETTEPSEYAAIGDDDSLCDDLGEIGQIECVSSEDYVEIGDDSDDDDGDDQNKENMTRSCQKTLPAVQTLGDLQNQSNKQPRSRLVSISMTTDTSHGWFSDSQQLSPDSSDKIRVKEDLDGHIVPFLDESTDTEDNLSDEHVYEEAGFDSEGESVLHFDRKSIVNRSRSVSGKVPETVLEEPGSDYHLQNYCEVGLNQSGPALSSSPMLNSTRGLRRPHRFLLYPRSFSMEGRDPPLCVYREVSQGEMGLDSLSLPSVMGSSGSFSQQSYVPSSGLSTPTSAVDIPPPFELAYITKKPITKSSPSLFIEGDCLDRQKKKKSTFKRFLMLKFRRKSEKKLQADVNVPCSRSPESGRHVPASVLDSDRHSMASSPQLLSRVLCKPQRSPESPSTFLLYKDVKRKRGSVAFLNRSVARVESFEERSHAPFTPLPLSKPRSISFPNADMSDYENLPAQALSSDYENIQIPSTRPVRLGNFPGFFDRPIRVLSSANETDGYVDMSSFPGFESKAQSPEEESESAYTEAYNVCSIADAPRWGSEVKAGEKEVGEEYHGRTSEEEEEEGGAESNYDRQNDGRSRAFYIAKELLDTERLHVKALKLLQEDFREAVGAAVGDEGDPVLDEERLREILNGLPDVYTLHRRILTELENRIRLWDESQRIADVVLSRKSEFVVFTNYIGHYDRRMSLLDDSCATSPAFSAIVRQYEQSPAGEDVSLKHQLLQVIVRVAQYRMLLTDYLNNLSPDSREYQDTQAALVFVSDIADQANDNLKYGENLLRLVNIQYSVQGQKDLLQPDRVFVKEGTLMKVSRKCRQPRHLFLMNDVLLYTYPQQDGKYRLINTLPLTGIKVSKPIIDGVQNALRIEGAEISITLAASSCSERGDWFHTLSRTVSDNARGVGTFSSSSGESLHQARERLWLALGDKAPTLVPMSHVMMCMNCTSDFSLTLRRHHCHACGRIVCRSCSRNRYPLKYLKDHMAKVCDHCYSELKKRGGDLSGPTGTDSPRSNRRSSRPLSAVFQNIHPPSLWRHRKGTASLTQVSLPEDSCMSGSLQRKRTKRSWKRLWFRLKDKVLYTYLTREEKVASESLPLLGFTVKLPDRPGGEETTNVFELYHKKTLYYTFKAEDNHTAKRWVNAMEEATVL
ncbi:hypothetical protein DPEC_G00212550 [Dallia pectoralis]|uniref:Uncharacterized protein n=1 Tax=Dallia pectoralis TaxID=75939 RepID=A0ACC2G6D7_DALPE|nr:hypothetical protein DPEC_G00212550 [Dallia pectoralis]